uniref:SFRICE_008181 n=1 Tax=Spodoptera frugiperda TaxID=7108 RepID=A0A2H1V9H4_SPOFR
MSDAEQTLRRVLDTVVANLQLPHTDISIKSLTSGGANYTSALYSVTISAPDQGDLKLFAKVADVNVNLRKEMNIELLYSTEQIVYNHLVGVYEKIQDKYDISPEHRFVFPKFYGGEDAVGQETVVMEDVTSSGYTPYSRFKSIDWEHAAVAVEDLARLHALSFAYQKEDLEGFTKDTQRLRFVREKMDFSDMRKTWRQIGESAMAVVKEEHREKFSTIIDDNSTQEVFFRFRAPLSTIVLVHGDYRVSNLMFRRVNGVLQQIVVDYQTVHSGCPVTDLLYLEFLGTDQAFRNKHHNRLYDYYFSELTKALDRFDIDVNKVYPRETFEKEIKEMYSVALTIAMVVLPLVLVDTERAPLMSEIEGVNDFAIKPSQLFATRFRDLVSDCIEWGGL